MTLTITTSAMTAATQIPISCGARLYDIPTSDAACAVPSKSNYAMLMSHCCGPATVTGYYGDCGLYCLAQGQSVGQLVNCLTGAGAGWSDVFCNTNMTATATGTATATAESTASKTDGAFTGAKSDSGAAGVVRVPGLVSKAGLGIVALMVCAIGTGALI